MTLNEALRHVMLLHSIKVERYTTGELIAFIAMLENVDGEIKALIRGAGDIAGLSRTNLENVLLDINRLNADAGKEFSKRLAASGQALVVAEAGWQAKVLRDMIPTLVPVNPVSASPAQLYSAALDKPFDGFLLKDTLAGLDTARKTAIDQAVRKAFVEGTPTDELVRTLYGTQANGFNGLMQSVNRRQATAVARTALSHFANFGREETMRANANVLDGIQWVATLDSSTCLECAAEDGQTWGLDEPHPSPPLHYGCRCDLVPVVKSWQDLGLPELSLSPGTRASMNGQVPETWTFPDWLGKQSAAMQKDVLGTARYKLYQAGTPMTQFVVDGRILTLKELGTK